MIISALSAYYDQLLTEHPDEVPDLGWTKIKISYLIVLAHDGQVVDIVPDEQLRLVPEYFMRTSGTKPYVLADNSSYLLGIDNTGSSNHAKFDASKAKHQIIFSSKQLEAFSIASSTTTRALCSFFDSWKPEHAFENDAIRRMGGRLYSSQPKLSFQIDGRYIGEDESIKAAWTKYRNQTLDNDELMLCLDSGRKEPAAITHHAIRGIDSKAKLVSFNEQALESYGHENKQGLNAPVSRDGVYKYAESLNYLANSEKHHFVMHDCDISIFYWADRSDDTISNLVSPFLKSTIDRTTDERLHNIMDKLSRGCMADIEGFDEGASEANFYILGLEKVSDGRLAVRCFEQNSFGKTLNNIQRHYERLTLVHPHWEFDYLTPKKLVLAGERQNEDDKGAKNSSFSSELYFALLQSILNNATYPEALYRNVLQRIYKRSEKKNLNPDKKKPNDTTSANDNGMNSYKLEKVSYAQAAYIKAYLIKRNFYKERTMKMLDSERTDTSYVLGRLFWTLEYLQKKAIGKEINTTISDKYFKEAASRPSLVFGVLLEDAQNYLSKLRRNPETTGIAIYFDKRIGELLCMIQGSFPKTFSLEEQGDFVLGYYHQKEDDYRAKPSTEMENSDNQSHGDDAY